MVLGMLDQTASAVEERMEQAGEEESEPLYAALNHLKEARKLLALHEHAYRHGDDAPNKADVIQLTARQARMLIEVAAEQARTLHQHAGDFALGSPHRRFWQERADAYGELSRALATAADGVELPAPPGACGRCGRHYADHLDQGGSRWQPCTED
jgi:hypothetical protein